MFFSLRNGAKRSFFNKKYLTEKYWANSKISKCSEGVRKKEQMVLEGQDYFEEVFP